MSDYIDILEKGEEKAMDSLNFGSVIGFLKHGKKMARAGWLNKEAFIYYVQTYSREPLNDVEKDVFGESVECRAYIALKVTERDSTPWVPTTDDIIAEDWYVVE